MTWQSTPYAFALVLTAVGTAALAYLAWRRRAVPGGGSFAALLLAAAEWSLGYALEMSAADLPSKMAWADLQYLGITSIPPLWLLFALAYTGRRACLGGLCKVVLGLVPAITVALAWLEGDLGLIRTSAHLDTSSGFAVLAVDPALATVLITGWPTSTSVCRSPLARPRSRRRWRGVWNSRPGADGLTEANGTWGSR